MSNETRKVSGWSTDLSNDRSLFVSTAAEHPFSDSGQGRFVSFISNGQRMDLMLSDETIKALTRLWRYATLRDRLHHCCSYVWAYVVGRD